MLDAMFSAFTDAVEVGDIEDIREDPWELEGVSEAATETVVADSEGVAPKTSTFRAPTLDDAAGTEDMDDDEGVTSAAAIPVLVMVTVVVAVAHSVLVLVLVDHSVLVSVVQDNEEVSDSLSNS